MARAVQRWVEVTLSQFPHEAEGLSTIRSVLPANPPFRAWSNFEFRAWSNFEFRDGHGKWHEVDLLVLGRRRLDADLDAVAGGGSAFKAVRG